jgi:hypothetical protein
MGASNVPVLKAEGRPPGRPSATFPQPSEVDGAFVAEVPLQVGVMAMVAWPSCFCPLQTGPSHPFGGGPALPGRRSVDCGVAGEGRLAASRSYPARRFSWPIPSRTGVEGAAIAALGLFGTVSAVSPQSAGTVP